MIFNNNQLILFFSLPFYPVISPKKRLFLNGHIAVGIDGNVYQIFNPYLLDNDFLVSMMPINEWLYNDANYVVNKNKESPYYKYVHLYKKSELKRTTVFYCVLNNLNSQFIDNAKLYFNDIENKFREKKIKFNIFNNNCSNLISNFFYQQNLLKKGIFDFIPFIFFKRLIIFLKKNNLNFSTGVLFKIPNNYFKIRKFTLGLFSFNSEKSILKWLIKYNFKL